MASLDELIAMLAPPTTEEKKMAEEKESGTWNPTLGDVLRPRSPNAELKRLQEVGLDPTVSTRRGQAQNSAKTRDKNNDGENHPKPAAGEKLMENVNTNGSTESTPIRQPVASAPVSPAMPIQIVLTDDVKRALGDKSWSDDLVRFAPKAAIATIFAFGASLGFHYLTRPVSMKKP